MLFTDRQGRVLVVNPTYKPRWELPGGAGEEDESPGTAAVREIAEELGIVEGVDADRRRGSSLPQRAAGGTANLPASSELRIYGRLALDPKRDGRGRM
jgi:8-oxo-dGTP pyrophosphatase MutT (NUDIX family)